MDDNQSLIEHNQNLTAISNELTIDNPELEKSLELFYQICDKLEISDQLKLLSIKDFNAVKSCFVLQVLICFYISIK